MITCIVALLVYFCSQKLKLYFDMVKKEIKSIILYLDSAVAIDYLTDEQAGILFKAVLRYGRNGQMLESSDTALTALFTMLCGEAALNLELLVYSSELVPPSGSGFPVLSPVVEPPVVEPPVSEVSGEGLSEEVVPSSMVPGSVDVTRFTSLPSRS